ncbi:TonB-dependent receptor [Roseateles sp. DAIF2]|uniref:TonB-dependent receptor n=1 Tax=Roseateles sp. DAIF2 TaxID=2714952 RepID=UPI0018A24F70|nr:TonB-dependent receptor [Roseateles sp. DAIF2]QPF74821.1 TonB-dependent receptor [Roseateles sp. DAIF2]
MNSNRWSFTRTALSAAAAIVVAAPVMAQNTTSAVSGRVTANDGKPVAGATVSILHRESGSANNVTTDAEGRYSARGLRVGGPYTITVSKGSDKDVRDGIYLALAESLSLDLRLGGNQLETVVLTGSRAQVGAYNAGATGAGTSLGRQELDAYASISRSLQDYARIDPRLAQTDKERGEISALGQNSRFNSITVDGVNISDTFGLESNNLPTAKQPISIDAIQSVQVNLSNYDVTQKGYTGANINAVTKSGTNEFKGSVYYVYRDEGLAGQRYNRTDDTYSNVVPFKEDTKGATLGGPIIKDKLFFFASIEELKSDRSQPEYGPVGGALTNVAIAPGTITKLQEIAKSKYGFDAGNLYAASELNVRDGLVKLDWNINDQHRANVRYSRTEQSETNNGSFSGYSPTALQLTSAWFSQKKTVETMVAQLFSDWTSNFSTELKISNRDYDSAPENNTNLPAMALRFSGAAPVGSPAGVNVSSNRFLNFGTERSRHFNVLKTKTQDAYFGANWVLDDHELKFGGDLQRNKVFNAFFQDTKGNYTFACENNLTYAQCEAQVLDRFSRGQALNYSYQVPVAGLTLDEGAARFTHTSTGLFLQDTWAVNDKLTLGFGVRYDKLSTSDKPTFNAEAAKAVVAGRVTGASAVDRATGGFGFDNSQTPDGQDLIQPRFSFNYAFDAANKRKSQLRGGFGLFQGAAANVWLANPYSNTGMATRIITCGSSCPSNNTLFNPDPNSQPTNVAGVPPAANVDFIEKGLGQPSVWKFNLAYDAELPWFGLVAGAEWVHTKNRSGIFYRNLNLGDPTRLSAQDGRQMFFMPQSYNTSCWASNGNLSTSGACAPGTGRTSTRALSNANFNNVLMAAETKKGGGDALTFSLSKAMPEYGLNWQVAYTRTAAKEVSPLTSSVANSNYNSRAIYNPNEDVSANSAYLVKDRVSAAVNWSKAFVGKYKTTVGLFYEGRKGRPFSWTYANDMNGDNVTNDLMYIPTAPGAAGVVFRPAANSGLANDAAAEARFWEIVNANPALSGKKGSVVGRNSSFAAFVNSFDLRLSQEVPGFTSQHKGVISFDILNVGNLLNKRWGRIDELRFESQGGQRRSFVNFGGIDANGNYVYYVDSKVTDYTTRQQKGESQWAVQITAKYEF